MAKRYVYKNVHNRMVNIGGYQFKEGQELESDVLIGGFNEAVSNGFLELIGRKPETADQDAAQAPQTGSTGKVKAVFHMGVFNDAGSEVLVEAELDPGTPVTFPDAGAEKPGFEGWFKDAEFVKAVNLDKAKAPKDGGVHFYAKFNPSANEPPAPRNPNDGEDSGPARNSPPSEGSENK